MKKEYLAVGIIFLVTSFLYCIGAKSMKPLKTIPSGVGVSYVKSLKTIPLEDFFKNPEMSSFQLSPNGEYISYMKPWQDGNRRMNVYVKPINSRLEYLFRCYG